MFSGMGYGSFLPRPNQPAVLEMAPVRVAAPQTQERQGLNIAPFLAGMQQMQSPMDANPTPAMGSPLDDFNAGLAQTESGGNYKALNKWGYGGKYQFGQARLDDYNRANGTQHSVAELLEKPELQERVQAWHVGDIDGFIDDGLSQFIGQTISGVPITRNGMRAVAHLGGKGGMAKFLKTGGEYNPADALGTTLLKYARIHG